MAKDKKANESNIYNELYRSWMETSTKFFEYSSRAYADMFKTSIENYELMKYWIAIYYGFEDWSKNNKKKQ